MLHRGGFLGDGWLRGFGSPVDGAAHGVPSLARVNQFPGARSTPHGERVPAGWWHTTCWPASSLNGGAPVGVGCPGASGEMVYFAPDSFRREALGVGHSAWMVWLVSGALDEFYADLRRPGRQDEVRALNSDQGLSTFPPLWSAEARQVLSAASRRAVPMSELLGLARDSCRQFDGVDPGFLGAV
ncbi:DUF2625 family protein [Streptomyces sp. NBC_01591]|uniref:DUF2625 family protein n=1 Tax=Streptomyces sp. NBC_01591 TaxID=2975888 RepID=UPI003FA3BE87